MNQWFLECPLWVESKHSKRLFNTDLSQDQRIYSYATIPDIDAAKTLLKRLSRRNLKAELKARDIYRAGRVGLETPIKAQNAINLLLELTISLRK
ncbi:MAG: hypothetical protein E2O80_06540 [Betaproteobacteria bacterium]|nr:MAG: hypothetical protein E2O80_06540 [Betaproteobacteria bacterium]